MEEKPFAIMLLDAFESLYLENACLRLLIEQKRVPTAAVEKFLATWQTDQKMKAHVHDLFAEFRVAFLAGHDQESALERLLKLFPTKKDLN